MRNHILKIWILGISIMVSLASNVSIEGREPFFYLVHAEVQEVQPEPSVHDLIDKYAAKYGVSSWLMEDIINCETGGTYDPLIQSFVVESSGSREDSWGLAQIHLPAHLDVSRVQAINPDFALDFMAKNISEGNALIWTCYRNLQKE